jgi:hypothetical protein
MIKNLSNKVIEATLKEKLSSVIDCFLFLEATENAKPSWF